MVPMLKSVMMENPPEHDLEADRAQIKRGFTLSLIERMLELQHLMDTIVQHGITPEARTLLHHHAQQIALSAPRFGYDRLSETAQNLRSGADTYVPSDALIRLIKGVITEGEHSL